MLKHNIFHGKGGLVNMETTGTIAMVGKEYPIADLRGFEGVKFILDGTMSGDLICAFPNITDEEVETIIEGKAKIGLFMYMGIIFVSAKFGNKLCGDCGFHVGMYSNPENISVPEVSDGEGMTMAVYAIDSTNNIIKRFRVTGMGTRWTRTLSKMVEEQKKLSFDIDEYRQIVTTCQQRWSTKDIMKMSEVYTLGTKSE